MREQHQTPVKDNEMFDTSNENLDMCSEEAISVALDDPSLVPNSSNCQSCEELVTEIAEKNKVSDRNAKLQLLTLMPDYRTLENTSKYFQVPVYMARQAHQLKNFFHSLILLLKLVSQKS